MLVEELSIYDRDLNYIGIIDTYSSLRWRRKYFESGEFELHLQASKRNISYLMRDNIIVKEDSIEAGIIENIDIEEKENSSELIIKGHFLSIILKKRIIKKKINYSGPIIDGMKKILKEMRPFKMLEIEETTMPSETITYQATYKNVYKRISKLSRASGIGFRIVPDIENKKFIFQNYIGVNRSEKQKENNFYVFSEAYSNLNKANYIQDSSSLCNYALVGGQGEGEQRIMVEIDNTSGLHDFDIVEKFVDAKGESNEELSDEEYNKLLLEKGKENINDITETISFDVNSTDYKKRWNLGDIVTVKKEKWGFDEDKRITEVEEVIENNKKIITPVFGTPIVDTYTDEDEDEY